MAWRSIGIETGHLFVVLRLRHACVLTEGLIMWLGLDKIGLMEMGIGMRSSGDK